jgi:Common central domain of tyrosinase
MENRTSAIRDDADAVSHGRARRVSICDQIDPRNWYRNAFLHVFDCPHQNWWFLAWHRAYIGWLEATIREFSGDTEFALPYWD